MASKNLIIATIFFLTIALIAALAGVAYKSYEVKALENEVGRLAAIEKKYEIRLAKLEEKINRVSEKLNDSKSINATTHEFIEKLRELGEFADEGQERIESVAHDLLDFLYDEGETAKRRIDELSVKLKKALDKLEGILQKKPDK